MEDAATTTIFFPMDLTLVRNDSEVSLSRYEVEREEEEELQLAEGLLPAHNLHHQEYIDKCISVSGDIKLKWNLVAIEDSIRNTTARLDLRMVKSPPASKICSTALNPILFRTDCVGGITDVAEIATLLGVSPIDADWRNTINHAVNNDRYVTTTLNKFRRLRDKSNEADVSRQLGMLLGNLSISLGVETDITEQLLFQVGGLLAHETYAYHGFTDLCVRRRSGPRILTTEVKTEMTWLTEHRWYQATRAVQLLGALFTSCFPDEDAYKSHRLEKTFFTKPSPGLLVTQNKFKLYVLCPNPGQGDASVQLTCMTYPSGNDHGDTSSEEFLNILAICLLQAKDHQTDPDPLGQRTLTLQSPLDPNTGNKRQHDSEHQANTGKRGRNNADGSSFTGGGGGGSTSNGTCCSSSAADSPSAVNDLLVPEVSFHGIKIWYPQVNLDDFLPSGKEVQEEEEDDDNGLTGGITF